jgi:hypothetical protein
MGKLSVEFDSDELLKIEDLKNDYGIKQTTELIRFLLTKEWKELKKGSVNSAGDMPHCKFSGDARFFNVKKRDEK